MARGRRRGRRARPSYRWTGFNAFDYTQGATALQTLIYDPSVELARSRGGSKILAANIRGHLSMVANSGTAPTEVAGYIAAFGTDETKTVPTGAPWNILAQDIDIAQKRMLWIFRRNMTASDNLGPNVADLEINVKVKIRLYPQMALMLVTQGLVTNTVNIQGYCRTLLEEPQ